jgi:hypothetical protein
MVAAHSVDAVIGWHTSAVRERIAPRLDGRVRYLYTAVYESGERTYLAKAEGLEFDVLAEIDQGD